MVIEGEFSESLDASSTYEAIAEDGDKMSTVCFQLWDKPTIDDLCAEEKRQKAQQQLIHKNGDHIPTPPMTTRKEIVSWYLYDWANSPNSGVILAVLFPIFLTLLAEQYACQYNSSHNCDYNNDPIANTDAPLRVGLFFNLWQLKPSSFAAAMISISSLFQAIAYISISALADYGMYQHYLFRITAIIGALFNVVWIFFQSPKYWEFAGWWGAIGVIFFGLSLIFYNAYLPQIVDNHWQVRRLQDTIKRKNNNDLKNDTCSTVTIATTATTGVTGTNIGYTNLKSTNLSSSPDRSAVITVDDESSQSTSNTNSNYSATTSNCTSENTTHATYTQQQTLTINTSSVERNNNIIQSRNKNDNVADVQRVLKLKHTITDDISQWGFCCGYLGSVIMTIVCIGIIFLVSQTKTEFIGPIGSYQKSQTREISQLWSKPVIGANIVHGIIDMNNNNNNQQHVIFGFQLFYDEIDLNGTFIGNDYNTIVSNNHNNVISVESQFYKTDRANNELISKINVFVEPTNGILSGIQFISTNQHSSTIFGSPTNMDIKLVESQHDNFIFAGCDASVTTIGDVNSHAGLDIISGITFEFMTNNGSGHYADTLGLRLAFVCIGVWWLLFSLFAIFNLQARSKPSLPENKNMYTVSILQFKDTIKQAKTKYPHMFRFLLAYFLFSDAIGTTSSTGVLFAIDEFGMETGELVVLLVVVEISAVVGAFFFVWLQKKLQYSAKQMLMLHLIIESMLPLYAVFGIIEGSPFGLVNAWEMYLFVAIFGFNLGSVQSFTRSMFSYLIPVGMESQFFALYEITDKGYVLLTKSVCLFKPLGFSLKYVFIWYICFENVNRSSWIGPLMVAIVSNVASMRWGLFYLLFFFLVSIPIIYFTVDIEEGMRQAGKCKTRHSKQLQHSMYNLDSKSSVSMVDLSTPQM